MVVLSRQTQFSYLQEVIILAGIERPHVEAIDWEEGRSTNEF